MLPFGVTIPATVPQGSEIPKGLMNNPVFHTSNHPSMFSTNTPGIGTRLLSAIFSGLMRLRCYIILLHHSFHFPFPPHSDLPLFLLPSAIHLPCVPYLRYQTIITSYSPFFPKLCYLHFSVITYFLFLIFLSVLAALHHKSISVLNNSFFNLQSTVQILQLQT
jgi:hypothetical protein